MLKFPSLSLKDLAGKVRDGWFGLLGDTQGFPYNSGLFYSAYVFLNLVADGTTVPQGTELVPVTGTIQILDSQGNVAGSWVGIIDSAQFAVVVAGTYSISETYSMLVTIGSYTATFTGPGGSTTGLTGIAGTVLDQPTEYYFLQATLSSKTVSSPDTVTPIETTGPAPVV